MLKNIIIMLPEPVYQLLQFTFFPFFLEHLIMYQYHNMVFGKSSAAI